MAVKITITETMRSLLYLPYYLAEAGGEWQKAGLEVKNLLSPDAAGAPLSVLRGEADLYIGGPARVMMNHADDPDCPLVCFGTIVARNPFVLIGTELNPGFTLKDLLSLRVGVACEAPTPWLTLQHAARAAGLDPSAINRQPPVPMAENIARLQQGQIDVIQVMEPHTDRAMEGGRGHIWHRGSDAGEIGFSSFVTTEGFARRNPAVCDAVMTVLERTQEHLFAQDSARIAEAAAPYFPELSRDLLTRAIARYRDNGIWARSPAFRQEAYAGMGDMMVSGGQIASYPPFRQVVKNSFPADAQDAG